MNPRKGAGTPSDHSEKPAFAECRSTILPDFKEEKCIRVDEMYSYLYTRCGECGFGDCVYKPIILKARNDYCKIESL